MEYVRCILVAAAEFRHLRHVGLFVLKQQCLIHDKRRIAHESGPRYTLIRNTPSLHYFVKASYFTGKDGLQTQKYNKYSAVPPPQCSSLVTPQGVTVLHISYREQAFQEFPLPKTQHTALSGSIMSLTFPLRVHWDTVNLHVCNSHLMQSSVLRLGSGGGLN